MTEYKAENGETVIAQNEVQEAAFENAGLTRVDGKPTRGRPPKQEE